MGTLAETPRDRGSADVETNEPLLASFVVAVETAIREMTAAEVNLRTITESSTSKYLGELVTVLDLKAKSAKSFALGVSKTTAEQLAKRMLVGGPAILEEDLIRDCLGEIANVAAGQAKAILHGTPHQLIFSTPRFPETGELIPASPWHSLTAVFDTHAGEITLQLFVSDGRCATPESRPIPVEPIG